MLAETDAAVAVVVDGSGIETGAPLDASLVMMMALRHEESETLTTAEAVEVVAGEAIAMAALAAQTKEGGAPARRRSPRSPRQILQTLSRF